MDMTLLIIVILIITLFLLASIPSSGESPKLTDPWERNFNQISEMANHLERVRYGKSESDEEKEHIINMLTIDDFPVNDVKIYFEIVEKKYATWVVEYLEQGENKFEYFDQATPRALARAKEILIQRLSK